MLHQLLRAFDWLAYNLAEGALGVQAHAWPVGLRSWSAWQRVPYGEILRLQRTWGLFRSAQTLLAFLLVACTAVLVLGLLVRLRRRARLALWRREPVYDAAPVVVGGVSWASRADLGRYRTPQTPLALGQRMALVGSAWQRDAKDWLTLPWTDLSRSVLDIAPPGAGKSIHLIWMLLSLTPELARRYNFFIWDVKGELAQLTAGYLGRLGYRVTLLHPFEKKGQVNPVVWMADARTATLFWTAWLANSATSIGGTADEEHEQWSLAILVGMTLALRARRGPTGCTLPDVFDALAGDERAILATLEDAPDGGAAASQWRSLMAKTGTAFSNQRNDLVQRGALFKDPEPRWFCSGHDLDLRSLYGYGDAAPQAVFFQIPTAAQKLVMPLTAGITAILFARIAEESGGRPLPKRLLCLLDELGASAKIPDLPDWINLLRGYGVGMWLVVQHLGQLQVKYGRVGAEAIKVGCATWLARKGNMADREEISARIGAQIVLRRKVAREIAEGKAIEREVSRKTAPEPLYAPDLIPRIPAGALLVLPNDGPPLMAYLPPYYADGRLRARAGTGVPAREDEEVMQREDEITEEHKIVPFPAQAPVVEEERVAVTVPLEPTAPGPASFRY